MPLFEEPRLNRRRPVLEAFGEVGISHTPPESGSVLAVAFRLGLDDLDIPLPKLPRRYQREFKNLEALDPAKFGNQLLPLQPFTPEETREIVFKTMLDAEIHHTITLDGTGPADYRSVVAFFARQLLKDLRLVGGYDLL